MDKVYFTTDDEFIDKTGVKNDLRVILNMINIKCKMSSRMLGGQVSQGLSEKRFGVWNGREVTRLCVILGGNGCSWYRSTGGCLMCNFPHKCPAEKMDKTQLELQVIKNFERHIQQNKPDYHILCIYNSGSFFSEEEVPSAARREILKQASEIPLVKQILVESRSEFISHDKVMEAVKIIAPKELVIGIGLESESDFVRNEILLKNLSRQQFERSAKIITSHCSLLAYILVGAPLLTERERITDAIKSFEYAQSLGADTVVFQLCNVQPNSAIEWLWSRSLYRPPWLWSMLEILKEISGKNSKCLIAGYEGQPKALDIAYNCPKCSSKIWAELNVFCVHQNINMIDLLECTCKKLWLKQLEEIDRRPLLQRLISICALAREWLIQQGAKID